MRPSMQFVFEETARINPRAAARWFVLKGLGGRMLQVLREERACTMVTVGSLAPLHRLMLLLGSCELRLVANSLQEGIYK